MEMVLTENNYWRLTHKSYVLLLGLKNPISRPGSASAMLTLLSQFQALGWEKWLS